MLKSKLGLFYVVVFLLFASYIIYRQNSHYGKLTDNEGRLTVAHVYSRDTGSKGSIFYNYIYQVRSSLYTTSTSGSNVRFLDSISPQYFVVAYNDRNPSIHTLLWSYKLTDSLELGARLDSIPISKELIRKHTIGLEGLAPKADLNDLSAINEYRQIIRSKRKAAHNISLLQ